MSLVGPKPSNPTLTVEFNTRVSADAYSRARDGVLLTRGVTFLSEDEAARTLKVEIPAGSTAQATIENIPGVEKVTREQKPGGYRPHRL
ncbi:MAG TPA: hypothetical protein VEF76_09650 [Patescibacteria group bacterium]|nr:hypothetical protein [Patescibacteria group bacterium]